MSDFQIKESEHCKYSERLPGFRSCNEQKCEPSETRSSPRSSASNKPSHSTQTDPKVDLVQNDITPGMYLSPLQAQITLRRLINLDFFFSDCEDKFPNCHLVIRAQLCTYDYYINHCCATCREAMEIKY